MPATRSKSPMPRRRSSGRGMWILGRRPSDVGDTGDVGRKCLVLADITSITGCFHHLPPKASDLPTSLTSPSSPASPASRMKLASLRTASRDGQLIVVSRDLSRAMAVPQIAGTLQQALDDWSIVSPKLRAAAQALERGEGAGIFAFDSSAVA